MNKKQLIAILILCIFYKPALTAQTVNSTKLETLPTSSALLIDSPAQVILLDKQNTGNNYVQTKKTEKMAKKTATLDRDQSISRNISVSLGITIPNVATKDIQATLNIAEEIIVTKDEKPAKRKRQFELLDTTMPESFYFPPKPVSRYPDITINGFYEGKISGRDFNPKNPTWNIWETIRRDPIYNKIPRDVLVGEPKFEMRYNIGIEGKLSDDLSVHYDIDQEPDFPGKYDIVVKHKKTTLTFHHFDAEFQNGEFINVRKALDGVKLEGYDNNWEGVITTGKQRSEPVKFGKTGNGTNKVSIGRGSILEGSVQVWVNNGRQKEGVDYEVNHFDGTITFTTIKTLTDYIEIICEFTNPIEDFIPVLSRKNFFGAQYLWRSKAVAKEIVLTKKNSETFSYTAPSEDSQTVATQTVLIDLQQDKNRVFQIKEVPIVLGSEIVKLNDRYLRKNIDYSLKHSTGKLKLLEFALMDIDKLTIEYESYQADKHSEDLIANNSFGPYLLAHKNIIPGTVTVNVDDIFVRENEAYVVDYKQGRLRFNYKLHYPQIISVEYSYLMSAKSSTANIKESPLSIGVTYLNEYVKAQEEELVVRITSENLTSTLNSLPVNNRYLYAENTPFTTSQDIEIYIDGILATPNADYEVVNPYKGLVKIIKDGNEVVANYSYRKSYRTSFMFGGTDGIVSYENGTHFQLRDIPMKYRGLEYIRLRHNGEELKLSEGYEYYVDYGDNGQEEIAITFIKESSDNFSKLDFYPGSRDTITLIYKYTPAASPDQGNIDQKMIGITLGSKINDNWSFQAEIAGAENNFSKPQVPETKELSGTGIDNSTYMLRTNMVEDSEYIFIRQDNGRTILLTKDKDYFIHYTTGTLRFINLTPRQEDIIEAQYEYYDTSGITQAGESEGYKLASKFSTEFNTENFNFKSYFKKIDKEFLPLAPIQDKKGSQSMGSNVFIKLSNYENIQINYERKDEIRETLQDKEGDSYLHTDNLNSVAKINFFNFFDTQQEFRYTLTDQDPLEKGGQHKNDVRTIQYNGSASFGPSYFRNTITKGFSKKIDDYIDGVIPVVTQSDTTQFNSIYRADKVFLLGEVMINPSYQTSEQNTNKTTTSTQTEEKSSTHVTTRRISSQIKPLSVLSASFDLSDSETRSAASNTTENITTVENKSINLSYNPFTWLRTNFYQNRSQSESPLVGQTGRLEIRDQFSIQKFMPAGFLTFVGLEHSNFLVKPLHSSYFTYSTGSGMTTEHNDKKKYNNNTQKISYNKFAPFPGINLEKVSFDKREGLNRNLIETRTASRDISSTAYERVETKINIKPQFPILDLFTYTLGLDKKDDIRITKYESDSGTSNSTTYTQPSNRTEQSLSFNPGPLRFGIRGFLEIDFGRLKASVNDSIDSYVNSELKEFYPTTNKNKVLEKSESKDETYKRNRSYNTSISPFNLIPLNGNYSSSYETRRYNLADNPFRITETIGGSISGVIKPFSFLGINASYTSGKLEQFLSPSLNISESDLESTRQQDAKDYKLLSNYLNRINSDQSLGLTLTPFSFISIKGGGKLSNIKEANITVSSANPQEKKESIFDQKTGSAGLVLRPLSGLEMSYTYSLTESKSKANGAEDSKNGYSQVTRISYTPVQTNNFKVSLSYSREDNWGFNLNNLEQQTSEQGSAGTIATKLGERNDSVENGTLSINITIPLTNSPFIDRFEIVGEGYLKKVMNNLDKNEPDPSKHNSYDISGMSIKGTLYF